MYLRLLRTSHFEVEAHFVSSNLFSLYRDVNIYSSVDFSISYSLSITGP
jgi:hypothetical protein